MRTVSLETGKEAQTGSKEAQTGSKEAQTGSDIFRQVPCHIQKSFECGVDHW